MSSDEPGDLRSWSQSLRIGFSLLMGVPAGAIPGVLVAQYVSWRLGVALVFLGMPIGTAIAFGIAKPSRLLRLLAAILVAKNVRPLEEKAWEWVDKGSSPDEVSVAASDRLMEWLSPSDAGPRRGGWVLAALVLGMIGGATMTARDVMSLKAGGSGLILPIHGAKDSLVVQAGLMSFCIGIWTAAGMGVLVSRVFRRRILFAAGIAGYLGTFVGFAGDERGDGGVVRVAIMLTTAATAVALLLTGMEESPGEGPENEDPSS